MDLAPPTIAFYCSVAMAWLLQVQRSCCCCCCYCFPLLYTALAWLIWRGVRSAVYHSTILPLQVSFLQSTLAWLSQRLIGYVNLANYILYLFIYWGLVNHCCIFGAISNTSLDVTATIKLALTCSLLRHWLSHCCAVVEGVLVALCQVGLAWAQCRGIISSHHWTSTTSDCASPCHTPVGQHSRTIPMVLRWLDSGRSLHRKWTDWKPCCVWLRPSCARLVPVRYSTASYLLYTDLSA